MNIDQKIEKLKHINFNDQEIAIVIPTLNTSHQLIEQTDPVLYWAQRRDASGVLHYIGSKQSKQNDGAVCILLNRDEAHDINRKFDQVIFIHEPIASEKEYIIDGLQKSNENIKIIELQT